MLRCVIVFDNSFCASDSILRLLKGHSIVLCCWSDYSFETRDEIGVSDDDSKIGIRDPIFQVLGEENEEKK